MDLRLYNDIKTFIKQYRGLSRFCFKELISLYPSISKNTLGSICSLNYQHLTICNHHRLKSSAKRLYKRFTEAVAEGQSPGIIIRLAQEMNFCPALVARTILSQYYIENKLDENAEFSGEKLFITSMMKDTSAINDRDLAFEVFLCVTYDDQYGPVADSIKNCIGADYEEVLKAKLGALGVSFKDECVLRARGYDKTPDVKLDIPFATQDGAIVNWIESKALFADNSAHAQYVKNQYVSYWNREYLGGERYAKLDAKGKVVIITGANSGIGCATALQLAELNATVVMACRDSEKCELEREKIVLSSKNKYIYCRKCDLASQESIRQFVDRFNKEHSKLDILVNNAAVMNCPKSLTEDGIETQLGVNHMGHFLLTNLLLDKLKASTPSRIITLCDPAYHKGVINTEDFNSDTAYDGNKAYTQSKLANMLFTQKLSKDLEGSGVTVNSVDPGTVDSNLLRHTSFYNSILSTILIKPFMWPFIKSCRHGGQAVVYAALDPGLEKVTGKCFKYKGETQIAPVALDTTMSDWLWLVSCRWTKLENTINSFS